MEELAGWHNQAEKRVKGAGLHSIVLVVALRLLYLLSPG